MTVTIYGKIKKSEPYQRTYLYTVQSKTSTMYILSDIEISENCNVKVTGTIDNIVHNGIIRLVINSTKVTLMADSNNHLETLDTITFSTICKIDSINKINKIRYIVKYKIMSELVDHYSVIYIVSIVDKKSVIEILDSIDYCKDYKITIEPIRENSKHSKRKYDMMCKTLEIKEL